MGLFGKKKEDKKTNTKCKVCDLELHQPERLERHMKKAHGNVLVFDAKMTSGFAALSNSA